MKDGEVNSQKRQHRITFLVFLIFVSAASSYSYQQGLSKTAGKNNHQVSIKKEKSVGIA